MLVNHRSLSFPDRLHVVSGSVGIVTVVTLPCDPPKYPLVHEFSKGSTVGID